MRWRRKRKIPSVTELHRIEAVLQRDLALRRHLGPRTTPARKRNGETVYFAELTWATAQEVMASGANPERAHVRTVLLAAAAVLRKRGLMA
jgi:hypothetical protein